MSVSTKGMPLYKKKDIYSILTVFYGYVAFFTMT
jgi:hypothetical protein